MCILSLNRPEYLRKQIAYYRKFSIKVIILDASETSEFPSRIENIEYHHLPHTQYHFRLNYLAKIVSTQFIVMQADDDFHSIGGLSRCISFLQHNSDYSSAQGRYLRFNSNNPKIWITDYDYQNTLVIDSNDPEMRVEQYFDSGMHFIYSVMPTQVFVEVVELLKDIKSGLLSMNELVFSMTLGCFGKYKTVPVFYSVRGKDLRHFENQIVGFQFWSDSKGGSDYELFRNAICNLYSQKINAKAGHANEIFESIKNKYELRVSQKNILKLTFDVEEKKESQRVLSAMIRAIKNVNFTQYLYKFSKKGVWRFFWDLAVNLNLTRYKRDFKLIKKIISNK